MYIEFVPNRNSPPAILLRESYREDGKVKKRTLANFSKCPPHAIEALKAALKDGPDSPAGAGANRTASSTQAATPLHQQFEITASTPHGHVAAVVGTLKRLGLPRMLDRADTQERRIALALIAARILFPSSKLATLRLLAPQAILNSNDGNSNSNSNSNSHDDDNNDDDSEDDPLDDCNDEPDAADASIDPLRDLMPSSTLAEELGIDIEALTLSDIYAAMRWLFARQKRIEKALARLHLKEGSLALYDLTSTYYEGSTCALAQHGHNRDKKKGKLQINIGLLCDEAGRPVSCEAFPGNTGDPKTVTSQVRKLRKDFRLKKVILVGDRGMLTQARIDEDLRHLEGLAWISALNHKSVSKLVDEGSLQPELFDEYSLAEIESASYPDERLVVCFNPPLAKKRNVRRNEMLAKTEAILTTIKEAAARTKNPYKGKTKIARRVQREAGKYKMLKHFHLEIEEERFEFERNTESITAESALDGYYIIRAGRISKEEMSSDALVTSYKSLSRVERAFRTFKSIDLRVRPIHHREDDMVRGHLFLCMLGYYVEWHMRDALAPMLFTDEDKDSVRQERANAAEPVQKSASARLKAERKTDAQGLPLHSFQTMMEHLRGVVRNRIEPGIKELPAFVKVTLPDAVQSRALQLLGLAV